MAAANKAQDQIEEPEALRDEWLSRLSDLVTSVKSWAEGFDWSTRQISKKMKDSRLGPYEAPALIMQKETTRVLLDPVARFASGADGIVDLYLMPAYDDIASLYFVDGEWRLHYQFTGAAVAAAKDVESCPLCKETFGRVLEQMSAHAASSL